MIAGGWPALDATSFTSGLVEVVVVEASVMTVAGSILALSGAIGG